MLRFAVKAGLAFGAGYYLNEQGVWKDSNQSVQTYEKLKVAVTSSSYVREVTKQLPELEIIPKTGNFSASECWNKAVVTTFKFLTQLPDKCGSWVAKGTDTIMSNEEIRKMFSAGNETKTIPNK